MAELFSSGLIADWVLGMMALEACVLLVYRRRSGRGPAAFDWLPNLASGACLMLALRAALVGAAWVWIASALAASLLGHLADLGRRWQGAEAQRIS